MGFKCINVVSRLRQVEEAAMCVARVPVSTRGVQIIGDCTGS
jgi:hypothetical protein